MVVDRPLVEVRLQASHMRSISARWRVSPFGGRITNMIQSDTCGVNDVMTGSTTSIGDVAPPLWSPTARELDDVECFLLGAYSSVPGFLGPDDIASVTRTARLVDGAVWPVSITLEITPEVAVVASEAGSLLILDEERTPVATVSIDSMWDNVFTVGVAGAVEPLSPLERGSHRALRASAHAARKDAPVLGIPVLEPPHLPQLSQWQHTACELGASIMLLPLTGDGWAGPVDGSALVRVCLDAAGLIGAEVVPVAVPSHGDHERDRLLAGLVARAYGATHLPGPLRAPDAEWAAALPRPVELPAVARDRRTDRWVPTCTLPVADRADGSADDVGTNVHQMVSRGEPVPDWLTRPAVVQELTRNRAAGQSGFTVLMTGLSGSGKSTIAKALHSALLDRAGRSVTLLDGDLVRSMLSSELNFSREHRDLNVRRIGFVATEVTRHGGIALCAPIAPYAQTREAVRSMITPHGGFLLVHVATPIEACEARDRKGLYARARAGLIPEFTGISDPYEPPTDADVTIDTTMTSVIEAVEQILDIVTERGWLVR